MQADWSGGGGIKKDKEIENRRNLEKKDKEIEKRINLKKKTKK